VRQDRFTSATVCGVYTGCSVFRSSRRRAARCRSEEGGVRTLVERGAVQDHGVLVERIPVIRPV
jgi:hypothetical protein